MAENAAAAASEKPLSSLPSSSSKLKMFDLETAEEVAAAAAAAVGASGDADDYDEDLEEMNILLVLLKRAYADKDITQSDAIVETMVTKSHVVGLTNLHTACGYGLVELVEKYLNDDKSPCDPNSECTFNGITGITPIHFCAGIGPEPISDGRDKCVELLVKHGADVNRLTSRKDTALHWATKMADFKVCEKLVKLGADVNKLNTDNCTCAHGAAFYKNTRVLDMLIDNRCNIKVQDVSGKNILHLLCKASFEEDYPTSGEASAFSLNEAASTTTIANNDPTSANLAENYRNRITLVRRLIIKLGIDPNLTDEADFNCLMYACEQDNIELIQTLIDCGANVNYINKDGVTCMTLAIVNSCTQAVKLLLKNGFDLKKNKSRNFSYITDAAYLNDAKILNILMQAGCDVNETKEDETGVILNPLWAACERGNIEIVEMLLAKGARPVIRDDLKMTALHCACMAQYECLPIVKLLIDNKCPINLKSTSAGETPLFLASNSGYSEIVEYLLSLGVDPNESSSLTRSCFQQALFRAHKEIVVLLLEHGYKVTEEDRVDLDLYIMDLYQEDDVEMLKYLLARDLITKEKILDAVKRVNDWRATYRTQQLEQEQKQKNKENVTDDKMEVSTAAYDLEDETLVATLNDLKLEINPDYPTNLDELDVYLNSNQKEIINLSDENEELK